MNVLKNYRNNLLVKMFFLVFVIVIAFHFDKSVYMFLQTAGSKAAVASLKKSVDSCLYYISHGATLLILTFILYTIGKLYSHKLHEMSIVLFIGFLSSGAVSQILKRILGRARPGVDSDMLFSGPTWRDDYHSFPSGHAAVAFCFAYVLSQYYPRYKILFYLFAVTVAFHRVVEFKHFTSDVLAGAVIGIFIAKFILKTFSQKRLCCQVGNDKRLPYTQ